MTKNHFIVKDHAVSKRKHAAPTLTTEVNNTNNIAEAESAILSFLDITINEMNYHFNSAADIIKYNEAENAIIYFENEDSTRFGWLNFKNQVPDKAETIEFFEPATGTFLILFKKTNSIYPVMLTEYNSTSEFITGHYTGIYTDAKDNPVYKVTCKFNIRRH